ncbi:hypothetical protein SIN8267_02095 [Sinobacterium norvegicum]|uniref:Class GN sortase n=2 Tax=Sinobacterium norvegicum TaxID=1641715 RepID=A0ABN8ELE1_9GAMM|nr:hypothetical protein SIN8267_02095 [Sinobacterium norvegicum]
MGQGVWIYTKAELAQHLIAGSWQQSLHKQPAGGGVKQGIKPWPWADTWPVARLQLSNYGIDMFVLAGGTGNTLAFGPGHLTASSDFDQQGAKIIAGHRDTHFNFLKNIVVGDKLVITDLTARRVEYKVESLEVVDSRQSRLNVLQDVDQLVLVTCFPFDAIEPTTLRYKVIAKPVVNQTFFEGRKL